MLHVPDDRLYYTFIFCSFDIRDHLNIGEQSHRRISLMEKIVILSE